MDVREQIERFSITRRAGTHAITSVWVSPL